MFIRRSIGIFAVFIPLVVSACAGTTPVQSGNQTASGKDPQNATYLIDGEVISLVDGEAIQEMAPGSASKQETRYFGNPVEIDLDDDGRLDTAFLLFQESGGSGTFYYVTAALNTPDGYLGTNAIFLGDRIAPQSTVVDPNDPSQFIVSYAERLPGEPMSSEPTSMVSRTFRLQDGLLVEVGVSPTATPLG